MQFSSLFTLLAAGLSLVAAQASSGTSTTTSTQTVTATVTITQCNPTVTNCPARANNTATLTSSVRNNNTTSSAWFPVSNSTKTASATGIFYNSSSTFLGQLPTTAPVAVTTKGGSNPAAVTTQPGASSQPSSVTKSGAGSLFIQSGLLLGVVGAGMAVLA